MVKKIRLNFYLFSHNDEKSTLGDLEALAALKEQMVEGEKKKLSKKKESESEAEQDKI